MLSSHIYCLLLYRGTFIRDFSILSVIYFSKRERHVTYFDSPAFAIYFNRKAEICNKPHLPRQFALWVTLRESIFEVKNTNLG